jgi:hypothetical protein
MKKIKQTKFGNWMNLKIGDKIKIGKKYSKAHNDFFEPGKIIILIQGYFDEYNGLYSYTSNAPSIWDEDQQEYSSIFHLFGNDLERFMDCEIIRKEE